MKKSRIISLIMTLVLMTALSLTLAIPSFGAEADAVAETAAAEETADTSGEADAAEGENSSVISAKAVAAGLAVGVVGAAGAIGMAIAIGKCAEGMARQPEAAGKINGAMMLGLVFIETAIIYALIIAILIIFVL